MDQMTLGRTGLSVSVVGLGCGGKSRLGQSNGASTAESVRLVQAAIDRGITLLDTAALYGTEGIVGEALAGGRRQGVVLSTKLRIVPDGADPEGSDLIAPDALRQALGESLRLLRTDCVDILHLHGVMAHHYDYCRAELLPVLQAERQAGRIRFIGLTERFSSDMTHAGLARAFADDAWDVVLVGLNFVNQTALRPGLLPLAAARGIGTMAMFAVRGALATERTLAALVETLVARGEVDKAQLDPGFPLAFLTAPGVAGSLTDAAYRFCRHAPGIDVVLTGTGNLAHLDENIRSILAGPLPEPVLARLAAIFGGVHSVAPN